MKRKYKWFTYLYEPLNPGMLGTKHERTFKAIDEEHAHQRAKKEEDFCMFGIQVYRLSKLIKVVE